MAIDTKVLVRYYIDNDHTQHKKAKSFIDDVVLKNLKGTSLSGS